MANESKKNLICYVGDSLNEDMVCTLTWFKSNKDNQNAVTFEECAAEVSEYLISLGVSEDHYSACPNATEKWLIINQTKLTIPAEALICPKYRLNYGLGFVANTLATKLTSKSHHQIALQCVSYLHK